VKGLVAALVALGWSVAAAAAETPARVVTLAPHLAELMCAAGACDRLVAVADYTDHPDEAAALPRIGDAFRVSLEVLVAMQPTHLIVWEGGTPPERVTRLQQLGIEVVMIRIQTLEDIARALRRLGALFGTQAAADAEAARFLDRLEMLRATYGDRTALRVFYQVDVEPAFTINGDSPISEALNLCGAVNVFADLPRLAMAVGREHLATTPIDAVVHADVDTEAVRAFWAKLPQSTTRAPALIAVDADRMARASPGMLDALGPLCEALDRLR
jgi:iron complex transport system substrate-binding protein